ncbi:MAG: hypothetical protein ACI85O_000995 [Saprospiraceae bacterium]|jgi:hypothetical protein
MIKSIIKLGLLLVVGILVYNFFLGTPDEKAQSQKVFDKGKDVIVSVGDLLRSEKEKFDSGKYDTALDKIGSAFDGIRDKAREIQDEGYLGRLNDLDKKRKELQEDLSEIAQNTNDEFVSKRDERKADKIKDEIDKLMDSANRLVSDMEEE